MDNSIEVSALTKRYPTQKGRPAIDDLNFAVPGGQLYGLLGPDGSGKTTALRILATVIEPTAGHARLGGFDCKTQAEKIRRDIGYMPQNFSLYPDLTVSENLNFFADLHHVPKATKQQRIGEMLAFAQLSDFQQRPSGLLSGGMKKKLALACALMHNPRLLLLDEPSTGVDPVSRRELWIILAKVVQQGVTVLVSTPYMDEAERCHTVGILHQGRLLTSGTPKALEAALPFEIVEVKAKPRKVVRQAIQDTPGILAWRPVGDRLRLSVSDAQAVQPALERQLTQASADIKLLRSARRTMEDVFIHLVESQRGLP